MEERQTLTPTATSSELMPPNVPGTSDASDITRPNTEEEGPTTELPDGYVHPTYVCNRYSMSDLPVFQTLLVWIQPCIMITIFPLLYFHFAWGPLISKPLHLMVHSSGLAVFTDGGH